MNVAYSCNDNFFHQTEISVLSLLEHNAKMDITVYFIDGGCTENHVHRLKELVEKYAKKIVIRTLETLLPQELLANEEIITDDRHPATVYAKLFLDLCCDEERILYLDSDTVICESLLHLWEADMADNLAMGIQMPYSEEFRRKNSLPENGPFLCDGVVLINLELWKKWKITKRICSYLKENHYQPPMMSEGVLNHICKGHIGVLVPSYNLMSSMILWNARQIKELYDVREYYSEEEINEARRHPVIVHFLNEIYIRPWYRNSNHPYRAVYGKYEEELGIGSPKDRQHCLRMAIMLFLNKYLPYWVFKKIFHWAKRES